MNFWGATIGRSGTVWLSGLLNQSPTHACAWEDAEEKASAELPHYWWSSYWAPFPVHRWDRPNYGEFHGFLLRYLLPGYVGLERTIPRRFVVIREPRDVIASWMNQSFREPRFLPGVVREVLARTARLTDYQRTDPGCRLYRFEELTTDQGKVQELVDWLDLGFTVTGEMMEPKHQSSEKWFTWDAEDESIFQTELEWFGKSLDSFKYQPLAS